MSAARLFTALELPGEVRTALGAWGSAAARADPALRAVRPDALHVTLHFLGMRPEAEIGALGAAVRRAAGASAPLAAGLGGALWLAPRRPHVLTCAVEDPDGALAAVHGALGGLLAAAAEGWSPERRAPRPHVTVARVRRGATPRVGAEPPAPRTPAFTAPAVVLFRSVTAPGGARYEALERAVPGDG